MSSRHTLPVRIYYREGGKFRRRHRRAFPSTSSLPVPIYSASRFFFIPFRFGRFSFRPLVTVSLADNTRSVHVNESTTDVLRARNMYLTPGNGPPASSSGHVCVPFLINAIKSFRSERQRTADISVRGKMYVGC